MKVRLLSDTLIFEGELDEYCDPAVLLQALKDLKKKFPSERPKLDLSKIKRANSSGIVNWLRFAEDSKSPFDYVNCPVWLVSQFNMINIFLGDHSKVLSLQVPYFCENTEASQIINLEVGSDIPLLEDYSAFQLPDKTIDGKIYEADVNPTTYFSFLSLIKHRYKG